jgi:hypothetical protein
MAPLCKANHIASPSKASTEIQLVNRYSSMEIVPRFLDVVPVNGSTSSGSREQSWLARIAARFLTTHSGSSTIPWSKLRIRVLRRDHYRCRACDTKGDEITLLIYCVHPDVISMDGFLTLCFSCKTAAKFHAIEVQNIPQFLQVLWRHLHNATQDHKIARLPQEASTRSIAL